MSSVVRPSSAPRRPPSGAAWLTLGGLAAAFAAASCCALPLLLTTFGLGTAWLGGMALLAAPHRGALLVVGALGLSGGAVLLWRQHRAASACGPDGACTPAWVRGLTLVGVVAGLGLLCAGYVYA
jgi:mercuric ion transport protein